MFVLVFRPLGGPAVGLRTFAFPFGLLPLAVATAKLVWKGQPFRIFWIKRKELDLSTELALLEAFEVSI